MQKKRILVAPILFLYYEESVYPFLLKYNKVYFASSLIAKPNHQHFSLSAKQDKTLHCPSNKHEDVCRTSSGPSVRKYLLLRPNKSEGCSCLVEGLDELWFRISLGIL
jgi:hypothetical protein